MKSNEENIQEELESELEVSRELDTFSRISDEDIEEYYCMDCRIGNTEDGEEAVCEACAYL